MGMPSGGTPSIAPKKKHARGSRGRGGSKSKGGKLGSDHAQAFMKAHAAGDHASARTHALNYANATMKGMKAHAMEPDADQMGGMPDSDPDDAQPSQPMRVAPPQANRSNELSARAKLAALAMKRRNG